MRRLPNREIDCRCPRCGTQFQGTVWASVDVEERRDLFRRAVNGTLHEIRCPGCLAGTVTVSADFVLFRPSSRSEIICRPDEESVEATEGVEVTQDELPDVVAELWPDLQWIDGKNDPLFVPLMLDFVNSTGSATKTKWLRAHADKLDHVAADLLWQVAELDREKSENSRAETTELHARFVEACLDEGLGNALAEYRDELDAVSWSTLTKAQHDMIGGWRPPRMAGQNQSLLDEQRRLLEELNPDDNPELYGSLCTGVAIRLRESETVNRREPLREAFVFLGRALAVLDVERSPNQWATAMAALATTWQAQVEGSASDNIEKAKEVCESALATLSNVDLDPGPRGAIYDTLGSCYLSRSRGDRAENLERAIEAYGKALAEADGVPQDAAELTLNATLNLALAYMIRVAGDRVENLTKAARLCEENLDIFSIEEDEFFWAHGRTLLAEILVVLADIGEPFQAQRAEGLLLDVLRVRRPDAVPAAWAETMLILGRVYAKRAAAGDADYRARAIEALESVKTIIVRAESPHVWARLNVELASLQDPLDAGDVERTVALLDEALTILTPHDFPDECRRAAVALAHVHVEAGDFPAALRAIDVAVAAGDNLYRAAYVPHSQRAELGANANLYSLAVRACVEMADDPEMRRRALVLAEAGRDRIFATLMGLGAIPAPGIDATYLSRERDIINRRRMVENSLAAGRIPWEMERKLADERAGLQAELDDLWASMEVQAPDYVALRRGDSPSWEDMCGLVEELGDSTALASVYTTDNEIFWLVLRSGWAAPVVKRIPLSRARLVNRFLLPYEREVLSDQSAFSIPTHSWLDLGEELLGPIMDDLDGADVVHFIPHGYLHSVPLHALNVDGRPFVEKHACTYAPSAAVLLRTVMRSGPAPTLDGALVLGYTASADEFERRIFLGEAEAVAGLFGVAPLLDSEASGGAIRARATSSAVVHLSCHGYFNGADPMDSAVMLADGAFTGRDFMRLELHADLVTLSSCRSGFARVGRGDEITGLSRALLYAGASSALLTLWAVEARSTLEWMLDFYARDAPPAAAFRKATLALRESLGDPRLWAPFILVGFPRSPTSGWSQS